MILESDFNKMVSELESIVYEIYQPESRISYQPEKLNVNFEGLDEEIVGGGGLNNNNNNEDQGKLNND